ncbi:hypothetical protein SK128_006343 [Halocaridina rubra]|uniref:BZIP domain-containing protein n=1 Tax=Halocaridina rubra TaxID=373956 RepID=A0AAN9AG12_HALRR
MADNYPREDDVREGAGDAYGEEMSSTIGAEGGGGGLSMSDCHLNLCLQELQRTVEEILQSPARIEEPHWVLQNAGEFLLNLQITGPSTSGTDNTSSSSTLDPNIPSSTFHDVGFQEGQNFLVPEKLSMDCQYPSSGSQMSLGSWSTSGDFACSSSVEGLPFSQELFRSFAPKNPRETDRGGYTPSVFKQYDLPEDQKMLRNRDLRNKACKRYRKSRKETLENMRIALIQLQEKNQRLRVKETLLRILRELYKKYFRSDIQ